MTNKQAEKDVKSPFERFKDLASNLVSVPKSKVIEKDKKEREQKKRNHKKQRRKEKP